MQSIKKRFVFLLSHPIQYFSPLFVELTKQPGIDLVVLYCSDENVKGHIDKGFGVKVKWDVPLLEGYNHKFLKNNSWKASIFNGFWGLINLEIFQALKKERGDFLIVHGWNYTTHSIAIIYGKLVGLKICVRGDNPYNQEVLKDKSFLFFKKILLGKFLFKFIDYFLYVGKQNKEFYRYYGVPESKLVFTPHAVDNDRFRAEYCKYRDKRLEIRQELGLPIDKKIILTSGKYIPKKRPFDLLKAYQLLHNEDTALVLLGDGELKDEIEEYIEANNLKDVYLTGFKNQSEVGKYFAAADIFVLSSGTGETWGLVVNEAMNFGLPIICSDLPGSAYDLIKENENGFVYKTGDFKDLSNKIGILIVNNALRTNMGIKSLIIVKDYSYKKIIDSLSSL